MIGLNDVVQVFDLPVLQCLWAFALVFQLGDRYTIGRRPVGVNDLWLFPILQAIQGFAEKSHRCLGIAGRR